MLFVLEKTEAHLFTSVCRFVVRQNSEAIPAIIAIREPSTCLPNVYTDLGVNFDTLAHVFKPTPENMIIQQLELVLPKRRFMVLAE